MADRSLLSSLDQLAQIGELIRAYRRMPFSDITIPGAVLEQILADVREARVLRTYDFVDVIHPEARIGWQVKSTKASTPVTWKRAKLADSNSLIQASRKSESAVQDLGRRILDFCNEHAAESLRAYDLAEIGYARLVLHTDNTATYFERTLLSRDAPRVFGPEEFEWRWSTPKNTSKKEQLQALHGYLKDTGQKWFAWHGLGENQLHFSGESAWWPLQNENDHAIGLVLPPELGRMGLKEILRLIVDKAT